MLLLALPPYVAIAVLYWHGCGTLFGTAREDPPDRWMGQLCLPVLAGTLTPLAVIARADGSDIPWLVSSAVFGVLFAFLVLAVFDGQRSFHALQRPSRLGRFRPPRWMILRGIGLLVIAYASGTAAVAA